MAKVPTNISEKIFNISAWRGVNEAPEGEAALKLGEASRMRNFRVTSGGALKKRPGSRNVAGLLSDYVPEVRDGTERLLMVDTGVGEGYEMYPRAEADSVGRLTPKGDKVTVTAENAREHIGYYILKNGELFKFTRCEITQGAGSESIGGGMATPGILTEIASGSSLDGKTTGTQELETFSGAYRDKIGVDVRGEKTTHRAPEGIEVGWSTQNVGGYCLKSGRLYRYYGARIDTCVSRHRWKKYKCVLSSQGYTYYTEGEWETVSRRVLASGETLTGYAGYSFNKADGTYSGMGQRVTVGQGSPGTVYDAFFGFYCRKITVTGSVCVTWKSDAQGPFTGYGTTYAPGEALGDVVVPDGENPEADRGYLYVDTFSVGDVSYTVMRLGQNYFCYTRDRENWAATYERTWSFHGYPLIVSPNIAEWYGAETYSRPGEVSDSQVRGIWSGFVGGREVLCAACGGSLWELSCEDGVWSKVEAGRLDTSRDVQMFGFDEKLYILNGVSYTVWDGERLSDVEGYRPLVSVSVEPSGGGTLLEGVNRLTAGRRCWFSPDGEATVFKLPEAEIKSVDWVKDLTAEVASAVVLAVDETRAAQVCGPYGDSGDDVKVSVDETGSCTGRTLASPPLDDRALLTVAAALPGYTVDLKAGTVTFETPPAKGINTLEVAWSAREDYRAQVRGMRFAEVYNGAQDTRVFLYGDGTNKALYSGLDHDGRPRADYFPDLYEVAVGDANTPITAMIRHYNKLMAFKPDSAWSIGYDAITLVDGTVTAGFYVTPVNRSIGNCAYGQAQLVQNRPRTLDGRSVIEWRAGSGGNIIGDQRNAERVSQRVDSSIRGFDLTRARTFYDKFAHEYYVIGEDGTAIVQNLDVDAWYVYTGLDVTCMINYRDELYYGTRDGFLRHFSQEYFSDNGEVIDAYWESGAMSFSEDFRRKYSAMVWIGIKPEDNAYLEVTARTDRKSDFAVYDVETPGSGAVPEMERIKLKAKKFTYYKLILQSNTADKTVTVVSADMRVRGTGII